MTLPAATGIELVAAETAAAVAAQLGADEAQMGDVRMAVVEGCVNVIEHAYRRDGPTENCASPEVDLRFEASPAGPEGGAPAKLLIRISDRGHGFDLAAYEEPTLEKKLHSTRKRGWGLKLMRSFMDEFQISTGRTGTTIEMTKLLAPARG